jgi:tetratricopeptide (TPR) repeat protein
MNNFDKIEAYLLGMMDDAEQATFEQAMATDTDLKSAVEAQKLEHRAMELAIRDDLRAQMSAWSMDTETASPLQVTTTTDSAAPVMQVSFVRRNFFKIAAAASVLLVLGFFGRSLFGPSEVDTLSYFNSTTRSSGSMNEMPEVLRPGLSALKGGRYDEAIAAFGQVTDPNYKPQALLFSGECYFRLKKYEDAIATFTLAESMAANAEQKDSAQWFRFLALKAAGKKAEAAALKAVIRANDGHTFWEEAGKVE